MVDEQQRIERYLASSTAVRRTIKWLTIVGLGAAVIVGRWWGDIGWYVAASAAITGAIGGYITTMRIQQWREELHLLHGGRSEPDQRQ